MTISDKTDKVQFTYGQLFSHIKRFLITRGGDILTNDEAILDIINFTLQDLYNEDSFVFRYEEEVLEGVLDNGYTKYSSQFNIQKVERCNIFYGSENEHEYSGNPSRLEPTLFNISNENEFKFKGNLIYTHSKHTKIRVIYIKDYEPVSIKDISKPIPVPFRYVPAIIKMAMDWAAPINLMSGESSSVDFYNHGITRTNKLSQQDGLTDFIDVKPGY